MRSNNNDVVVVDATDCGFDGGGSAQLQPDQCGGGVIGTTVAGSGNAQLWFHRMELNGGRSSWTQFIQLVNTRFGPPLTDTPLGELAMLCRTGSMDEFAKRFMVLSCRDPSITEPQQIQLFITGLGDPLHLDVTLQQPSSMDDAVIFARAYE
jgi:hypothetical protein